MGKATRCAAICSELPTGPAESETLRMRGRSMHENREIPQAGLCGWHREVRAVNLRSTTAMNSCGKSDSSIVPVKPSNKYCGCAAVCGEGGGKGADQGKSVQ